MAELTLRWTVLPPWLCSISGPSEHLSKMLFRKDERAQRSMSVLDLFFLSFVILGPHPQHMEVPRLGFKLELLPPAYAGATATPDPNRVCDLHHSSQHRQILNPLSEVGNLTCNLMVPSCFRCATMGPP